MILASILGLILINMILASILGLILIIMILTSILGLILMIMILASICGADYHDDHAWIMGSSKNSKVLVAIEQFCEINTSLIFVSHGAWVDLQVQFCETILQLFPCLSVIITPSQ